MENDRLTLLFERATPKQREVLELITDNQTSKEIAYALNISESAVNQRIESLRSRAGNIPRNHLARFYREWAEAETCKKLTGKITQLPSEEIPSDMPLSDVATASPAFVIPAQAPWQRMMPSIVPEVFDGPNGTLFRTAAIIGIALGILILALLGLALAIAITSLG